MLSVSIDALRTIDIVRARQALPDSLSTPNASSYEQLTAVDHTGLYFI